MSELQKDHKEREETEESERGGNKAGGGEREEKNVGKVRRKHQRDYKNKSKNVVKMKMLKRHGKIRERERESNRQKR